MPAESGSNFQLGDLARVARERLALTRTVALVAVALTLVVVTLLPTLYSSSASVMLDPRRNTVADLSSVLSQLPTDPASLQNQIQILTSRDLALETIGKLKLYDDPEFNRALQPGTLDLLAKAFDPRNWLRAAGGDNTVSRRDAIIDTFLRNLSVDAQGLSTTLTATFTSRDPVKAALVANTLVDTYVEDQLNAKREVGARTTQWLLDRTRLLAQQVQAEETAVQRYKAENNLNETADGTSFADQQINAISNQLVLARADLAEKQATNDRVAALAKAGDAADISQIMASPLIVQLRTQQATLIGQESELSTRYGPRHPKMVAAETQKRDLQDKIATEVNRLAGSISNDVVVARAQAASLQASLKQAENQASAQNLTRVKLKALEANAQSTRTMYEAFVTRLRETQDQDVIQNPDARVISRAPIPNSPSSPKRMLIVAASLPAGLLLGLLAALLAERFETPLPSRPIRSFRPPPQPVSQAPPILARIEGAFDPRAADFAIDWPGSAFANATAALLRTILQGARAPGARVIAVTAAEAGPAGTAIAVALARTAARANLRVAVIDGNLQRPGSARAMGLGPVRFGLIELLMGRVPLSRSLCRDPRSPALVLSCAQPPRDPAAILGSAKMADLVAHLRRTCDVVIVDSPPLFAADEMRPLRRLADAVLVVARNCSPREGALVDAIAPRDTSRSAPVGFVLVS